MLFFFYSVPYCYTNTSWLEVSLSLFYSLTVQIETVFPRSFIFQPQYHADRYKSLVDPPTRSQRGERRDIELDGKKHLQKWQKSKKKGAPSVNKLAEPSDWIESSTLKNCHHPAVAAVLRCADGSSGIFFFYLHQGCRATNMRPCICKTQNKCGGEGLKNEDISQCPRLLLWVLTSFVYFVQHLNIFCILSEASEKGVQMSQRREQTREDAYFLYLHPRCWFTAAFIIHMGYPATAESVFISTEIAPFYFRSAIMRCFMYF